MPDSLPATLVQRAFMFDEAPFASCHAATLVEPVPGRLLAAFFGGPKEGDPGVDIWLCENDGSDWSPPRRVADGIEADGSRFACWNPVLFRPAGGAVMLFYKVGPSPSKWWGMLKTSGDLGRTWSDAVRLPAGILGPAKNKPVQLPGGAIISPASVEGDTGWRVYFERSEDGGATWSAGALVEQSIPRAVQPTILVHSGDRLQAICRTGGTRLGATWSSDAGRSWSPLRQIGLPNCNSGLSGVTLRDGRHVLIYNHSNIEKVRYPLVAAVSGDGVDWRLVAVLEDEPPGQYSYPAVIQSADGLVHVAYTWKRRKIAHVVLDPSKWDMKPLASIQCPPPGSPTHRADEFQ